jgi:hypothetical protein
MGTPDTPQVTCRPQPVDTFQVILPIGRADAHALGYESWHSCGFAVDCGLWSGSRPVLGKVCWECGVSLELHWEPRGVVKRFSGHVTGGDLLAPVIGIESDVRFEQLRYVINDLLDVQSFVVTRADVEDIAAQDIGAAATNSKIKVAIVAVGPEVIDLVEQYVKAADGAYPTATFSTMEEAREWASTPLDSWKTRRGF